MSVEIKEINTESPPGYPWHHGVHLLAYHCDTGTDYTAPVIQNTRIITLNKLCIIVDRLYHKLYTDPVMVF